MTLLRDWLYIGKYTDLEALHNGDFKHIKVVLNLAEALPIEGKKVLFLNIDDGVPLSFNDLLIGTEFLLNQYYEGKTILVACGAGVSRSATFCTVLIKEIEKLSLLEVLKTIKQKHPKALPHPELWKSVCQVYDEEFDYYKVLKA